MREWPEELKKVTEQANFWKDAEDFLCVRDISKMGLEMFKDLQETVHDRIISKQEDLLKGLD